mmetsp:Transcript_22189/g.41288  ORF Transcript_22189/g.41288 Transcript_22189/m.41288 type:complete len:110 (-) Transcript_22189:6-335(-)
MGKTPKCVKARFFPENVAGVFKKFDINGDGTIKKEECRALLRSLNPEGWTEERLDAINRVLARCDVNRDGWVDYGEFLAWIFARESVNEVAIESDCEVAIESECEAKSD